MIQTAMRASKQMNPSRMVNEKVVSRNVSYRSLGLCERYKAVPIRNRAQSNVGDQLDPFIDLRYVDVLIEDSRLLRQCPREELGRRSRRSKKEVAFETAYKSCRPLSLLFLLAGQRM
jgi:hypothetical protein